MKIFFGLTLLLNLSFIFSEVDVYEKKNGKYIHWQGEIFGMHNKYRKKHCVPDLEAVQNIASTAQKTAKYLCSVNTLIHSNDNNYGENIYKAFFPKDTVVDNRIIVKKAVNEWYKENKLYDYLVPENSSKAQHFTQLIWKDTTEFGCGLSECIVDTNKIITIVCNYNPRGNISNKYKKNVLKPCS